MKLLKLLQEVILPPNLKTILGKLKDNGYTVLGAGDNGIALQKGNQVLKLTTDIDELEHAEKLLNHSFTSVIPIKKVQRFDNNTGIIEMVDAEELTSEEKDMIAKNGEKAEDFLVYDEELDQTLPEELKRFLKDLKHAYTSSGINTDEIDWSPDNIMKYQENFVIVDV